MAPFISLITVIKDDIAGLKATANSILSQKSHSFEWVIIDGFSSDGSWEFAQELASFPNITLQQSPPTGIYAAMNLGADRSFAPWLWFINAGDVLLTEETLQKTVAIASLHMEASVIAAPVVYLTPTNHYFSLSLPRVLKTDFGKYALFHHQGCLLSAPYFKKVGGFDESFKFAADGKLLDSMILLASPVIISLVGVGFEMGGTTSQNFRRSLKEIRVYRTQVFKTQNMIIYGLKESIRGLLLKALTTPILKHIFLFYIRRREYFVINQAKISGLDLPPKVEFHAQ